jgi:hypothetical protein
MEKFKELIKSRNFWLVILILAFVIVFIVYARRKKTSDEKLDLAKRIRKDAVKDKITEKEQELNLYFRKLWAEHSFWTREYIVAYLNGTKDVNDVTRRLLKNQEQIGRALGMWYGEKNGLKVSDLLKNQLISFGDMLNDMVNKDRQKSIISEKKWTENTEKLVDFLVSLNKSWGRVELGQHFKQYNEAITGIAGNRLKKNHQEEIKSFDKAYTLAMYDVADVLTKGIVNQYPEKFDKDSDMLDENKEDNKEKDN